MSKFTDSARAYLEEETGEFLVLEEMTLGVLVDISEKMSKLIENLEEE
jgi:hypothetical protein